MPFQIETDILEMHHSPAPGGGVTTWFMHPGLPPIYHHISPERLERSRAEESYRWHDICFLIAAMRYEAFYEILSAHGRISVHASIAEARACRSWA